MGCDLVQGYLISRPLPEREFRAWWALEGEGRVEARLLHHHGGAVLLLARRQRPPHRRHRPPPAARGPRLAHAAPQVLLHRLLRAPGRVRRRLRRLHAQGQGHVRHQHDQDRGLRAALLPRHGEHPEPRPVLVRAHRLRRGGPGRGGLLAGQVRHPHRAPAARAAGGGQRLDRGPHRRLDRAGHRPGRHPHRAEGLGVAPRLRLPDHRHRRGHAPRGGHPRDRRRLPRGRALQPRHSRHRRALSRTRSASPSRLVRRFRALLHHALEGQAGADLARGDHALLGRGRDAAVHRAQVGRAAPAAAARPGRHAAGRLGHRHRHGRRPRRAR